MKSFEWNRFHKMILWTSENTKGNLLRMGVIMAIVFFLSEEFILSLATFSTDNGENVALAVIVAVSALCSMVGFTCLFFGASTMFACVRHKKSAISFLMHPASNLEKYLTRWIYVTIGWTIVLTVSFFVADYFRVLFNMLMGWHATESYLGMVFTDSLWNAESMRSLLNALSLSSAMAGVILVLAFVWTHSFYILGSAFFRRHPFILTSLAIVAIDIVLGITGYNMTDSLFHHILSDAERCVAAVILLALIVFNYWASYRLFKRTNVINNKWINI